MCSPRRPSARVSGWFSISAKLRSAAAGSPDICAAWAFSSSTMGSRLRKRSASAEWRRAAAWSPVPTATMPRDRAVRPRCRRRERDAIDISEGMAKTKRMTLHSTATSAAPTSSAMAPTSVEVAYSRPPKVTSTVPGWSAIQTTPSASSTTTAR